MEELLQSWTKLALSKREGPGCYLEDEFSSKEHIIEAKFLTERALNIEVIAKTFNPLWCSKSGFKIKKNNNNNNKIKNLGNHVIMFIF